MQQQNAQLCADLVPLPSFSQPRLGGFVAVLHLGSVHLMGKMRNREESLNGKEASCKSLLVFIQRVSYEQLLQINNFNQGSGGFFSDLNIIVVDEGFAP